MLSNHPNHRSMGSLSVDTKKSFTWNSVEPGDVYDIRKYENINEGL